MHHHQVSTNYPWLSHNEHPSTPVPGPYQNMPLQPLGNIEQRYKKFMDDCYTYYETKQAGQGMACNRTDYERIALTLRQPQSMRNYTVEGFKKIRAPDQVYRLLRQFWEINRDKLKEETFFPGFIYINHWESPTFLVSLEDQDLEGSGAILKQHIWNAARDTIQEWTGHALHETSLYGIRVYTTGAILSPHVDRNPLISSCIINVDQDVDEPWPLEVIGHDGVAHNVTMEPGDMVLYESHSVIHGRQFPLKGRFFANVFIHFEPIATLAGKVQEKDEGLPPYLIPGSPSEETWREQNPESHTYLEEEIESTESSSSMTFTHDFAIEGNLERLI